MARRRSVRQLGFVLVLGFALPELARGQAAVDRALILVEAGRMALDRGNPAVALEKAEEALSMDAKMPEALAVAAEGAFRSGDMPKAKRYVDDCLLTVNPEFRKADAYRRFLKVAAEIELLLSESTRPDLGPDRGPKVESGSAQSGPSSVSPAPSITAGLLAHAAGTKDSSVWSSLVDKATGNSWRGGGWLEDFAGTFREVKGRDGTSAALELAMFAQFRGRGNRDFRWAFVCYELWELEGDPATADLETDVIRWPRPCRYWHRGAAGEFMFTDYKKRVDLNSSEDWQEIHWDRPPTLKRHFETELGSLARLLDGKDIENIGSFNPGNDGMWRPGRQLLLVPVNYRVEPPAWSDQERAVFPAE